MALSFLQRSAISGKVRGDWYRALAKTTRDGLPLFEVLDRMQVEFAKVKHPLDPLLKILLFRLRGGGAKNGDMDGRRTIGTELRSLVPVAEAMLIQAGVASGNMDMGLSNAADLVDAQGKLKGAVLAALTKPVGYLAALIGLLVFFSIKLLPQFELGRPRAQWPQEALLLGTVADNITWIAGGVVLFFVLVGVALSWLVPNWTGPRRDWVDRHIFPFTMIASLSGASLFTSLAGYISAGTPIDVAITNIRDSGSLYMRYQCQRVAAALRSGKRAEDALAELSIIQPRYHWIIKVYGLSGDASSAYKTIAREMTDRTQDFIAVLFDRVISNLLLLLVGATLIWIYLSMFGIANSGIKKAALNSGVLVAASHCYVPIFQPGVFNV